MKHQPSDLVNLTRANFSISIIGLCSNFLAWPIGCLGNIYRLPLSLYNFAKGQHTLIVIIIIILVRLTIERKQSKNCSPAIDKRAAGKLDKPTPALICTAYNNAILLHTYSPFYLCDKIAEFFPCSVHQ